MRQISNRTQKTRIDLSLLESVIQGLKREDISAELSVIVGELCFNLNLPNNAGYFFNKALSVDPKNCDALNNLGVSKVQHGDYVGAGQCFFEAIELKPNHKEARENLAALYQIYGPIDERKSSQSVFCPCCGGCFPRFIPGGPKLRANAQCPKCGSLERHRLLWLFIENRTNLFSERLRVLHFAPEKVFWDKLGSMANLSYMSADLSSALAMTKTDITHISYKDDTFDVILCSHVLEHVMDDHQAMAELFRVLRPGGWAILQVPIDLSRETTFEDPKIVLPEDRERFFGQSDHVRWYGRDYVERLKKAGFIVEVHEYARELGEEPLRRHGLNKNEDVYFCVK